MDKLLLKPAEVAEALGVGRTTAYDLINSGRIPVVNVGAAVRVPADALRQWVLERTDSAKASGPVTEARR